MIVFEIVAAVLGAVSVAYLVAALVRPEWF